MTSLLFSFHISIIWFSTTLRGYFTKYAPLFAPKITHSSCHNIGWLLFAGAYAICPWGKCPYGLLTMGLLTPHPITEDVKYVLRVGVGYRNEGLQNLYLAVLNPDLYSQGAISRTKITLSHFHGFRVKFSISLLFWFICSLKFAKTQSCSLKSNK